MRENARVIDEAAADWVIRVDRGLTEAERSALEHWLAGDARRAGALARAQAAWVHVDRAQVYRSANELREQPAARRRRLATPWAVAAAVLLSLATGLTLWHDYFRTHLSTAIGEIRQVPLADGSRITLDTRSRVSVHYKASTRLVRLDAGEALFEVAKDPNRPFVVQAGNIRVRAVGTAFVVRRHSDVDVEVTVTQGTVDVWRETTSPEPAIRLAANNRTESTSKEIAAPKELTVTQLARATAWEAGIIDLNGLTLGEAAAEFNRYNDLAVVINDSSLANQTVVGHFQANDPTAFVNAAAAMLNARVRTDGDRLILEPRLRAQK
jgi:transmembrane sensor